MADQEFAYTCVKLRTDPKIYATYVYTGEQSCYKTATKKNYVTFVLVLSIVGLVIAMADKNNLRVSTEVERA